jgi:hypothetical protein
MLCFNCEKPINFTDEAWDLFKKKPSDIECVHCGKSVIGKQIPIEKRFCIVCHSVQTVIKLGDKIKIECNCFKGSVDNVNHPQHYTQGGIETIEYLQAKLTAEQFEGYLVGNILKYVSRYPHKNGIEDLKKAQWYINKLLEVKEK